MKKFIIYLIRWELSTLILAPCIYFLPFGAIEKALISNFIGACIFFWFDRWLFREGEKEYYNCSPFHWED